MKKILFSLGLLLSSLASATASVNTDNAKTAYTENQWEYYAAAEYAGGTGTEADPYLIATPEQLMKLAVEIQNLGFDDDNWEDMYSAGKYWKQTADIVLNENVLSKVTFADGDASGINNAGLRTFTGIGYIISDMDFQVFAGTYDGGGHSISGLYINAGQNKSTGVFNNVRGGVIKNLTVKDAYVTGNANVGLIVGMLENGEVMNCQTSGIIYCGGSYHAGIAGNLNNSKVVNCATTAWTWAKNNVGGVTGRMAFSSVLDNCFYAGWLGAVYSNVGKCQFWGALCPEMGKAKAESEMSVDDPDNPGTLITVVENPSKASNSYWMDTCAVRHIPAGVVEACSNVSENSKWGVVENCKAVAAADIDATVKALNDVAETIDGASKWENKNGMPVLTFEYNTTGISSAVTGEDNASCNVYDMQGVLVKKNVDKTAVTDGLASGIYIVNGKKLVVK